MVRTVEIGDESVKKVTIGDGQALTLIGGPCAIESEEHSIYSSPVMTRIPAVQSSPIAV